MSDIWSWIACLTRDDLQEVFKDESVKGAVGGKLEKLFQDMDDGEIDFEEFMEMMQ